MNYLELLLIGAAPEAGEEASRWVEGSCQRLGLAGQAVEELTACVVEAVNNSIEHAYRAVPGEITLTLAAEQGSVRVVIADRGAGPGSDVVDIPGCEDERGRGRWIMAQWCDSVAYERSERGFRTVLTKQCAMQSAKTPATTAN